MEEKSVQQKIILAVIDCIEKEGIHNLTTRSIAQEAGVNIAAINYYFRSKEKLVEEAFDNVGKHFIGDLEEILEKKDVGEVVEELLEYIFNGCIKFPNIIKAVLHDSLITDNYENIFVKGLNGIFEKLAKRLEAAQIGTGNNEIKLILNQFVATSLFMGLFPGFFSQSAFYNIRNAESKEEYLKYVYDAIMSKGLSR